MESGIELWAAKVGETSKRCATPEPNAAREVPIAHPIPAMTHCVPRLAPLPAESIAGHSTTAQSHAWPRLSLEELLPGDVLEVVLGFLDRKTLCTARLVSRAFCTAASVHICSLAHRGTFLAVSRQRFPRLAHVTLRVSGNGERWAQVDSCLLELITTLSLCAMPDDCQALITETLSHLALMPKLRELNLDFDSEGTAALLHQCPNLKIIRISGFLIACNFPVARTFASMTSLTELRVGRVYRPGDWPGSPWERPSAEPSWLQHFTALRKLQALRIETPSEALPLIGNLTGLTGLTWLHERIHFVEVVPYNLAPLTRLTRLKSVSFHHLTSESNVDIACLLGAGALADLALGASCDCGRFLTRQTALTRLTVDEHACNLEHIGALRLDLLQSLELERLTTVGGEGVSALRNAPSLTSLKVDIVTDDALSTDRALLQLPALGLSQTLGGLTQLRTLGLSARGDEPSAKLLDYVLAVGPLTGLTRLNILSGNLDNHDLRALLGLTGLRILVLWHSCLTDEVVPELAILTNLRSLILSDCGVTSLAPVTNVLNPLRAAKGWPPMYASIV